MALENFADRVRVKEAIGLKAAFRLRDMLFAQRAYLFAMLDYLEHGGGSRGSALYIGHEAGAPLGGVTQLIDCAGDVPKSVWREVHPLPEAVGSLKTSGANTARMEACAKAWMQRCGKACCANTACGRRKPSPFPAVG